MSLNVTLQLPPEVEKMVREQAKDLDAEVTEAYALELFRQGRLSHFELSKALGLDRFETDAFLKRHNVFEGSLTMEDLEADSKALERYFEKKKLDAGSR
jgi:predicted HTH domain antitoxin